MQFKTILRASMLAMLISAFGILVTAQSGPSGQAQVEPSYDVELRLLIGSNDGSRADLPSDMNNVVKQLRNVMPFSNYRLASTFLGRVNNNGHFEYKSLSNIFGKETELRSQSFLEWSLTNLRNLPMSKGGTGFQAQGFRFGARVPVPTGSTVKDETGRAISVVNYEQIGLNLNRIGLAENKPTLIGTLNLPGANDTIFLVMTVKAVEQ